jgi:hypothetical protein
MPVMQTPTGSIEFSDPNNVPEVFVNGPMNIINMGGLVQITFTTVRPSPDDLFKGSQAPEFRWTVVSRLLMPAELAQQLARTLGENLKAAQPPRAPVGHA